MAQPQTTSKEQRAYETIKQRIIEGTYGAGVRLVLDQLARDLQVSPVPIREAVRRLEAEGWVTFQRNVGAQVATIDATQFRNSMEVLAGLEGYATATGVFDQLTLRHAHAVNDRMQQSLAAFDPAGFTELNQQFHRLLCGCCPNERMRELLEHEWQRMRMLRRSSFDLIPGRAIAAVREHAQLLRLIEAGADAEVIERAARQHKLNTLRALTQRQ